MFRRILIWFGGMLLFSLIAFLATSFWLSHGVPPRDDFFRNSVRFQMKEAIVAYEAGGQLRLRGFLARLDATFSAHHHLADPQWRDLATGEDLSALARQAGNRPRFPLPPPRRFLLQSRSEDGRYQYLVEALPRDDARTNLPVYGWIVLVIVLLCYTLAWRLGKPIRKLRETVVQFGRGDLASRAHSRRKDEIGDLARSFDQMADRIETLLTAERRLLQDISHELRSPLARLRFALQLAKSSPDPDAAFARVDKEVDRLSTLVGELLQVTRAEGDAESRNVSEIDIGQFLATLVEDCRIEAEPRGCTIDLFSKERIVWAGDRELLHRAVENVLRNAIHHAPAGTSVDVDAAAEGGHLLLHIRDYGPGVPAEHLAHIFQPFFRVEADRARDNGGGVGLGLAIAQRAVRLHHGEVTARNMHPGLLVEIRLPR